MTQKNKKQNNIFIPFAYCSIERASSFLSETLGQTITIEDIEHLIELKIIKPCINFNDLLQDKEHQITLNISNFRNEASQKIFEHNDIKRYEEDNAPQILKDFRDSFFPSNNLHNLPPFFCGLDNHNYLSRFGDPDNESQIVQKCNLDELGLKLYTITFQYKTIITPNGLWQLGSYYHFNLLKKEKKYTFDYLPLIPFHDLKFQYVGFIDDIVLNYEDIRINADDLRNFIKSKSLDDVISPVNTYEKSRPYEDSLSHDLQPKSTDLNVSIETMKKGLGMLAFLLIKEKASWKWGKNPNAKALLTSINSELSHLGIENLSDKLRNQISEGCNLVKNEIPENYNPPKKK